MKTIFEITPEDVSTVLRIADAEAGEDRASELLALLDLDAVESAALSAEIASSDEETLSNQSAAAHLEIAHQLFRRGYITSHPNWLHVMENGLSGQAYWDFVASKIGATPAKTNDSSADQDRITDILLAAAQNGGLPAVKLLLRGAVAAFASEFGKTEEQIQSLPEPDPAILSELAEAIQMPSYQQ